MLSKEIDILMAERSRLLRVAGAAAQFVAVMDSSKLPEKVATEADILAESVNALAEAAMNPDTFNMSIRKFLKMVGVNSQREIEAAIERAIAAGKLKGSETLPAKVTLTLGGTDLDIAFDGKISLE